MPLPSSGQLDMWTIRNFKYAIYGWGDRISQTGYGAGNTPGAYDLNWYRGRWRTRSSGNTQFPSGQIAFSDFFGTSPFDEWNCDGGGGAK